MEEREIKEEGRGKRKLYQNLFKIALKLVMFNFSPLREHTQYISIKKTIQKEQEKTRKRSSETEENKACQKLKSRNGSNRNDVQNNCQKNWEKGSASLRNRVLRIKCWTKFPRAV